MIQKILVHKAEYWPELDTIVWDVEFLDVKPKKATRARIRDDPNDKKPKVKQLAFRANDLKEALGIVGEVSVKEWSDFCELMQGKVKNIDMKAQNHTMDIDKLKKHRKDIKKSMKNATAETGVDESALKSFSSKETQELSNEWHNYPFYETEIIENTRMMQEKEKKKQE